MAREATRPAWPASTGGCASRSPASRFATLVVEGTYVALIPDTSGPADATVICADEQIVRKLLQGRAEPVHRVDAAPGPPHGGSRLRDARGARPAGRIALRGRQQTKETSHEPRHGQHPRRQHLRRQRSARRSRRHADREPRPVPGGHALPLALDPDRRRHPAQDAVGRRAGLLQGPVLRGGDDRDGLRRLPPVGDAAALRVRRLRGDDRDREPRQGAGRAGRQARGRRRLRRSVRGEGQAGQGRPALHATSTTAR